jgi:hypothetical protein
MNLSVPSSLASSCFSRYVAVSGCPEENFDIMDVWTDVPPLGMLSKNTFEIDIPILLLYLTDC